MLTSDHTKKRIRPIIRVFVSSTFKDLKLERDALQRYVFPKLEQLCSSHQFQFQAIDLRWGVPTEASLDHRTMRICFEELRRSQEISPQPNFLILLGNRYGWRPLPEEISEDEFGILDLAASSELYRQILHDWYQRDENALPPIYLLQSRKKNLNDGRDYTSAQVWNEVQHVLWDIINLSYPASQLAGRFDYPAALDEPLPSIVRFQASAPEQEIWRGALGAPNAHQHVLAFFREIENVEEFQPVEIKDFVDVDDSGMINAVSQSALQELKQELRTRLGESNVIGINDARLIAKTNEKGTSSTDISTAHLDELSARVYSTFKDIITKQMDDYWGTSDLTVVSPRELELERSEHQRFGLERAPADSFVGRERHLQAIHDYLHNISNQPLVIHGASGSGKTALLARAAQDIVSERKPIVRFIGVTPRSTDVRSLLGSLCQELRERNPLESPIPVDVRELTKELDGHFKTTTAQAPLILFLDALDQLADADNGPSLFWIPQLPAHVKLIVSCLSDRATEDPASQPYTALKRRGLAEENFVNLDALSEAEAQTLVFDRWLPQARRKLNAEQAQCIREQLKSDACRQPLYLKVLFEEARLWRSNDPVPTLGGNVSELLGTLFNRLAYPSNHGLTLECALGYIAAARRGLTELEILEVLEQDPVYKKFLEQMTTMTGHKLPDNPKRIPIAIWSRLRFDLAPYLAEHSAPGGTVLNFYHRQVAEFVSGRFLDTPPKRQQRHEKLSQFFAGKSSLIKEKPPLIANIRKCDELPWQLIKSEDWDAVTETLCNLDFIQAKAAGKMTYDLVNDFIAALLAIPDNKENIKKENERQTCMDRYTRDLILYAKGEIPVLEVPESITPWTKEQYDKEIDRLKTNPTRLDRLKDFINFLGSESYNLQTYASDYVHFTYQQAWNFAANGPLGKAAEQGSPELYKNQLMRNPAHRPVWDPIPKAIQTLRGHTNSVIAVSITPDGKRAVSGSRDKTCILWDLNTGEAILTLRGHTNSVIAVSITPDGKRAVSGSRDKTCILWDLNTGEAIQTLLGHTSSVTAVSITPDGKRAVSGSSDKTCILWDLNTGEAILTLRGHTDFVTAVSITPDGKRAVSGYLYNTCILWDLTTGEAIQTLRGHTSSVEAVSITPDGKRAVSGSMDKTCILWDLTTGKAIQTLRRHTSWVEAVSITPDGKRAFSGSRDKTCILWDLITGKAIQNLRGHTNSVEAVSITPDGKRAVSGSRDKTCILWDLTTGEAILTLRGHTNSVIAVSITPDGKRAVSGSGDKTLLWDLTTGETIQTLRGHTSLVEAVSITPDGKRAVSGSIDNTCILWDLTTGKAIQTLRGHTDDVTAVSITLDGKRAVSGSRDNTCILWDLTTGEAIQTLRGHTSSVTAVSITPDGKRTVSVSGYWHNTCILWDLNTGDAIQTLRVHTSSVTAVSITPDGKRAVSGSRDKTCILWDLNTGKAIQTLRGHTSFVTAVSITPDGKRAVSSSYDNSCILWDLESGENLARVVIGDPIKTIAFYPSGIVIGNRNGEVIILNIDKQLLRPGRGIVTLRQIWDFEFHQYQALSADCPLCGHRFAPPPSVLDVIENITKEAGPKPEQSPCLELPKEASEDPGLLGECPGCGEGLKFNPLIVGGED